MLLAHFGETGFDTAMCRPACDICAANAGQTFEDRDMSSEALDVIRLVRATGQRFSLTHVLDVYRGSNSQAVRRQQHDSLPEHGLGRDLRWHVQPHCKVVYDLDLAAPYWERSSDPRLAPPFSLLLEVIAYTSFPQQG